MLFPNLDAIDRAIKRLFSAPAPGANGHNTVCPPADIALRRKRPMRPNDAGLDGGSLEPDEHDGVLQNQDR
jgi:hypothetical protein